MAVPTSGINLPHAPRRYRPKTAPEAPRGALPGAEAEPDYLGGPGPEPAAERGIEVEAAEEVVVEPAAKKATAPKRTPAKKDTTPKKKTTKKETEAAPPASDS